MSELTASAERALYERSRADWLAYVAPHMAAQLTAASDADAATKWASIPRDYQRAVWPRLDPETQQRIRALRAAAAPDAA